jgi:hypothetical protein
LRAASGSASIGAGWSIRAREYIPTSASSVDSSGERNSGHVTVSVGFHAYVYVVMRIVRGG